jgi:hypothetical protein
LKEILFNARYPGTSARGDKEMKDTFLFNEIHTVPIFPRQVFLNIIFICGRKGFLNSRVCF